MADKILDEAPIWSDLNTFDGKPFCGKVDCIISGYPCQPFSCAGKRQGSDDPRHLWPHIRRIVEEVRPAQCFFENVPNHLHLGFFTVCENLQALGYTVAAGLFSAEEVGAPHKRERLFILADSGGGRRLQCPRITRPPDGDQERNLYHWPKEPADRRVADGDTTYVDRNRAIGNSVVPIVAAYAYQTLSAALREQWLTRLGQQDAIKEEAINYADKRNSHQDGSDRRAEGIEESSRS